MRLGIAATQSCVCSSTAVSVQDSDRLPADSVVNGVQTMQC